MNALVVHYAELVKEFPPRIIRDADQNNECLRKIEELNSSWERLDEAGKELYETLRILIEEYEKRTFKITATSPIQVIEHLMEANDLKQKDLIGVFETASVVSEVLSGSRQLTIDHIRRLSQRFGVSPAVFFP